MTACGCEPIGRDPTPSPESAREAPRRVSARAHLRALAVRKARERAADRPGWRSPRAGGSWRAAPHGAMRRCGRIGTERCMVLTHSKGTRGWYCLQKQSMALWEELVPRAVALLVAALTAVATAALGAADVEAAAPISDSGGPLAQVTGSVQVTSDPSPVRAHATPQIARSPVTGALAAVEVALRDARRCSVHMSYDNGRTWQPGREIMVRPYTDCGAGAEYGPHAVPFYAEDGTLYVTFAANDPAAFSREAKAPTETFPRTRSFIPRNVYLAKSSDDGRTFRTNMVFEGPQESPHTGYNYAPVGAVDPNSPDRVYVGWAQGEWQSPEEPVKAVVAASDDGGESFAEPVTLSTQDGQQQGSEHPWVAVGNNGTVHATYWSKGFGKPLPDEDPPFIPLAREEPNPVYHMRSSDQGQTWERTRIDSGNQAYYRPPVVATGPDEVVYVAWYANPEPRNWEAITSGQDRTDLYLRASEDGGETWGPRQQVVADRGNTSNQVLPGISVSDDGRLDIAWHDTRNNPKPEENAGSTDGLQDIYYTFSEDLGKTFAPALRVNDRAIDRSIGTWSNNISAQTAVGIASGPDGAYLAWQDTRNGTESTQAEDVYSAAVRLAGAGEDVGESPGLPWWITGGVGLAVGTGVAMLVAWVIARRLRRKGQVAQTG